MANGNQCCNCGQEVTNDTAGGTAPACDECRAKRQASEIRRAINTLTALGYTVEPPQGKETA